MPSLAELQSGFARALRDPHAPPPSGVSTRGGSSRRFDVYRNNMVVSLVEALRATFPAVERLVGEEYFAAAARVYVERHPPRTPVLLCYGEHFGDFLDSFPSAAGVPYLGDVARLEWARSHALHAADAEPATIEALAGVPDSALESSTLTPHPSLSLVPSRWPVVSLWWACRDAENSGEVDMNEPETAVVARPATTVRVHRAPAGGGVFLAALLRGATLGAAAQEALDAVPEFDLAANLKFVFEAGAIAAVNLPEEREES